MLRAANLCSSRRLRCAAWLSSSAGARGPGAGAGAGSASAAAAADAGGGGGATGASFLGDPSSEVPTWKGVKRFYDTVTVSPAPGGGRVGDAYPALAARAAAPAAPASVRRTAAQPAWRVLIDGRELRTGALNALALPSQALALAVAGEFAAQAPGAAIVPASQPLYGLACAAADAHAVEDEAEAEAADARARAGWAAGGGAGGAGGGAGGGGASAALSAGARLRAAAVDFLETDTACFRIDVDAADPSERLLRKRQDKYYGPLLRWWAGAYGAPLAVASGLGELVHPPGALLAAQDFVDEADPLLRAATASVLGAVKSTVIAFAFAHRELDIEAAFQAARVEEEWQIAENGLVEDGHDTARAQLRAALAAARTLLWLSPTSAPAPLPRPGTKGYAAALAAAADARAQRAAARAAREDAALAAAEREAAAAARARADEAARGRK